MVLASKSFNLIANASLYYQAYSNHSDATSNWEVPVVEPGFATILGAAADRKC